LKKEIKSLHVDQKKVPSGEVQVKPLRKKGNGTNHPNKKAIFGRNPGNG